MTSSWQMNQNNNPIRNYSSKLGKKKLKLFIKKRKVEIVINE